MSEWLQAAEGKTVRDVEKAVSGKQKGQRPADPADPEVKTNRLCFEVSAEVLGSFRDAVDKLRRDTGEKLTEEEALITMMARQVLGGPGQQGRAGYQVAMTVCECCGQGYQQAQGELLPVGPESVELALCDAQQFGLAAGTGEDAHVGTGAAPGDTHVGTGTGVPPAVLSRCGPHGPLRHPAGGPRCSSTPSRDTLELTASPGIMPDAHTLTG